MHGTQLEVSARHGAGERKGQHVDIQRQPKSMTETKRPNLDCVVICMSRGKAVTAGQMRVEGAAIIKT